MKRVAKFLTALAGAGAQLIALGLVEGDTQHWVAVTVGVLTATAVYLVPNDPAATALRTDSA